MCLLNLIRSTKRHYMATTIDRIETKKKHLHSEEMYYIIVNGQWIRID